MRKISVLALALTVLVAGTAMAGLRVEPTATFTPGGITSGGIAAGIGPTTTNNDDSCDIGVAPAATLLLPYFEVDLGTAGSGRTTIFSITNVSPFAQIAHVTLWTDWSFPVLDFNIYLTGYDVQPINLFDIISRGQIGGTTGSGIGSTASPNAFNTTTGFTSNQIDGAAATGTNPNAGSQPFRNNTHAGGNPNFAASAATQCLAGRLPGQLPTNLATDVRALLTVGRSTGAGISCLGPGGEQQVGGNHGANTAIGYVTIDVAATCSTSLPTQAIYFTGEILFDNVLIGDYADIQQSATAGNYAGGNPMVHIRAVPEGGPAGGAALATNLPFTFYDRYTVGTGSRTIDRRQPLPSAFAARWIAGTGALFNTDFKIWREGLLTSAAACEDYVINSAIPLVEMVRFDERENASVAGAGVIVSPPTTTSPTTNEASRINVSNSIFPALTTTDGGGWMYMNLSSGGNSFARSIGEPEPFNATRPGFGVEAPLPGALGVFDRDVSQNWVIISMFAEGRYGVDYDAAWLGNGCSPALPASSTGVAGESLNRIAPAGGVLVCPTGATTQAATQCHGTNVTP